MIFEESYFRGEEKNGFYIRPMMKRYWAAHQEVILEFDRVCKKLGVEYYADFGTLLGAVRHRGFIPWDDDVDVCMLRGDYNRFRELATKEFQYGIMLYNDRKTSLAPLRIINTYAPQISEEFLSMYHGCPYSAGIDIYVLDRLPSSEKEKESFRELHQTIKYAAQRTDKIYMSKEEHDQRYTDDAYDEAGFDRLLDVIEEATSTKLTRDETLSNQLTNLLDRVQGMYWKENNEDVVYMHGWARKARTPLPESYYRLPIALPFEKIEIMVPRCYDKVLKERFGNDYMTPVKQIAAHEYPGYKKSQEILIDTFAQCGMTPPLNLIDELILETRDDV